mgnify:CR=1 FL=1
MYVQCITYDQPISNSQTDSRAPKSFVIRGGRVGKSVTTLVRDVRRIMEPNTATRLQEREKNKLRDYLTMAGPLGVSTCSYLTKAMQASICEFCDAHGDRLSLFASTNTHW